MKDLSCIICGIEIQGNYISYLPGNDIICSNECLIKYRKKRDEIIKAN
tara:strand:- start:418 stop:561 length:144 start_codon:yes stop_codon:yes gene_type:complete